MTLPATSFLGAVGYKPVSLLTSKASLVLRKPGRQFFVWIYIFLVTIWFLVFVVSTGYRIAETNAKNAQLGAKDSSVLILILEEISWISIVPRNLIILAIFVYDAEQYYKTVTAFQAILLDVLQTEAENQERKSKMFAQRLTLISVAIVTLSFLLGVTNWNHEDFSYIWNAWALQPFTKSIPYWAFTLVMVLSAYVPFLFAQICISTIVSFGHGTFAMFKHVNNKLDDLVEKYRGLEQVATDDLGTAPVIGDHLDVAELRFAHFNICRFVDRISETFSSILLVSVALDLVTALGFVGLIIGYKATAGADLSLDRVYQSVAACLWMGFFLTAEYWPFVQLHEEVEKSHHWVQALSLVKGSAIYQREMTYFLISTKHSHVGVVGGKIFMFSRNLCATMTSLLISFGILLYEILQKDVSGGLATIIESGVLSSINATLNHTMDFFAEDENATVLSIGRHGAHRPE